MVRQDVDHSKAVGLIAARRNRVAENYLFLGVMHGWIELKLGHAVHVADGPTCEGARHSNDVLLRVASIDAEGVKLEKLASVVFIEPRTSRWAYSLRRKIFTRRLRLPIVQIVEHRRVASRCKKQVLKPSQNKRSDGFTLVVGKQDAARALGVIYIEVVQPEVDQHLFELLVRVNRAIELIFHQFGIHELWRLPCGHGLPPQLR